MKTAQGSLLITNARMVDGTGAPAVADAAVIAKDGKITYAGPARARLRFLTRHAASMHGVGR